MATATVEIWRDTGFTEGSVEVPSKTSSLPDPDHRFADVNIPRGDLFSTIKLAQPFEDLYDCSYLRISLDMNNGNDVVIYGWIDTVSCASDTAGYPNTVVKWHPDLWRTYINSAQFGKGLVVKRPYDGNCPPQTYPYRFKDVRETNAIIPNEGIWWVVFKFVDKFLGMTTSCIGAFPIDINNPDSYSTVSGPDMHDNSNTVTVRTMPYSYLALGLFEELLEMDPKTLISVYLCPFDPLGCHHNGSAYTKTGAYVYKTDNWTPDLGFFVYTADTPFKEYTVNTTDLTTNDIDNTVITDFMGNAVGAIPWGLTVSTWKYRLVMDANGAYVDLRGFPVYTEYGITVTETRGTCTPLLGTDYTIPLIPVEITENSLASYVYSGQRDADRKAMIASAITGMTGGLIDIPKSASEGYIMSHVNGEQLKAQHISDLYDFQVNNNADLGVSNAEATAAMRTLGMGNMMTRKMMGAAVMGSGIGAVANAGITAMASAMQYANKQSQVSAQSNNLIMMGTGFDMFTYGQPVTAITMWPDAYSRNQRLNDLDMNGCSVSEATDDITSLIDAGGPLRILNPVVKGSIPTPAKEYIKQRLESGVRII